MGTIDAVRRADLAAFLRSRRERTSPEEVGLPGGGRRRTPGLRREEVAELAGMGVSWYTWLEQGRPIRVSVQVLNALAQAFRMSGAERTHLYRLADALADGAAGEPEEPGPELMAIIDAMMPMPVALVNERLDLLGYNAAYSALFPGLRIGGGPSNILWSIFTLPECCNPNAQTEKELPEFVARFRAVYGRHLGEPRWESLVQELRAASPDFKRLWEQHEVAGNETIAKRFRYPGLGELVFLSTSLTVTDNTGLRMLVYTPQGDASHRVLARLMETSGDPHVHACGHTDRPLTPPRAVA